MRISQIVISSDHSEKAPLKFSKSVLVFTEQGVAMLSSVLNSGRAIQVNIAIMRTFVKLRKMLSSIKELAHKLALLENRIEKHDGEIKAIFTAIRQLMIPTKPTKKVIRGFGRDKDA